MDLKQRLARLDRLTGGQGARRGGAGDGGPGGDDPDERRAPTSAPPAELGLREHATPAGPCWWREWRLPDPGLPDPLPGLGGVVTREPDRRPAREHVLLLDTETTGLAGGTGTLVFLVGLGWWEGSELVVRQLWLPGPGREGGLLCHLAELAAPFGIVATYNGAAFDLPLLRTRALLNRRDDPLAHLVSWDLLPACRRLWGRALTDCRQQTVESGICGLARGEGDIEGARIPEVWRAWLTAGDTDGLLCVLRHNQRDLAGMAAILARVCHESEAAGRPPEAAERSGVDWRRSWALARVAERRADGPAALGWARAALAAAPQGAADAAPDTVALARDVVRILKRARLWDELEALLDGVIAAGGLWAHREAAMLYEHRLPRLELALRHAEHCAEPARLARLRRRLARAAEAAGKDVR
jgi:uncharacterized protein